jgi:hypothetical protein
LDRESGSILEAISDILGSSTGWREGWFRLRSTTQIEGWANPNWGLSEAEARYSLNHPNRGLSEAEARYPLNQTNWAFHLR